MNNLALMLGLSALLLTPVSVASDLEREQRLATEVEAGLFTGDLVRLDTGTQEFIAIDTVPEDTIRGGIVIMHGRGFHPDWADVIAPLRTQLADAGWRTLSLQMPVLTKEAKYYDYVPIFPEAFPRIDAGIRYLRAQGLDKIIMIAHSCSVHMTMAWVRQRGDDGIDAYVGIGMGATDYQQPMRESFPLSEMTVPILDIYGSQEFPAVLRMAPARAEVLGFGHRLSVQVVVADADHYFTDFNQPLVDAVRRWLDKL